MGVGSNRWVEIKLGEIAQINMGQSPGSKFYNNEKHGYPFLQGNRTFGYRYPHFDTYCTEGKKFVDKGDVLISVMTPVGDTNIANERVCIGRGLASLKINEGVNDFLFYLLKANAGELINRESGTVFGSISKEDISNLMVRIPESIEDRKRIASILSALDDKIELNRQTNQTLEAIAQAICKEWFINFNFPTSEGKAYRDSGGEMQDSELGPIPKGWRVLPMDVIASFLNGLALQKYPPENEHEYLPVPPRNGNYRGNAPPVVIVLVPTRKNALIAVSC